MRFLKTVILLLSKYQVESLMKFAKTHFDIVNNHLFALVESFTALNT